MNFTKNSPLSLEDFEKIMGRIIETWNYQDSLNTFFRENNVEGYIIQPDCIDVTIDLLEHIMEDEGGWISYFCWDLDFGKCYEDGSVLDADEKPIRLATVQDLYNLLVQNLKCRGDD